MNREDFQRNRTWKWMIKLVWGGCSQEQVDREKSGLFSLRSKINFENTHPVEKEVFLVALVAEVPRKGWIFWHVGQTVANRSSKLVTLSMYKLEVIHPGFYFNSKATKPAEIHLRWVPWNKRISSGQQTCKWVPRACGGTRSRAGAASARHEGKNRQLLLPWQGGNKNKHQTLRPFGLSSLLCVCSLKFPQA